MQRIVASPPSSTIWSGPSPFSQERHSTVRSQYSLKVSPFQAKTTPVLASAIAEAAWSWVEKMLHEHHLTLAPKLWRVSIKTAVWMVIWREPEILDPFNGWDGPNSLRMAMRPGISTSASSISFLPQAASEISLTFDSNDISTVNYLYGWFT